MAVLLLQGFVKTLRSFFAQIVEKLFLVLLMHTALVSKFNFELKTLQLQGLLEPGLNGDLVYKNSRKVLAETLQFRKI